MQVTQLEPDIFVLVGDAHHSTAVVFLDGGRALTVDGLASRADAAEMLAFLRRDCRAEVSLMVCTHFMSDHMALFREVPQAPLLGHAEFAATFASETERSEEEAGFFRPPDLVIDGPLRIAWGRHSLQLFPAPGHTLTTLAIDVAQAGLLLVGDNVVRNIAYLSTAPPARLERALRQLQALRRPRVVPGHLGVQSGDVIDHALGYLDALLRRGEREIERCLPPGVAVTDFEREFHRKNLAILERRGATCSR